MKGITLIWTFSLALLASGCGPILSFHPLWDREHLTSSPLLEGRWLSEEGDEIITIEEDRDHGYKLVYWTEDGASRFEARLVRLEGVLYLDLWPDENAIERIMHNQSFLPVIPVHMFLRVSLDADRLVIALLDAEKITQWVRGRSLPAAMELRGREALLTADTRALQELMRMAETDQELWEEGSFQRIR